MSKLIVDNLTVAYKGRDVLHGASFVLGQGQYLAILGGNGSGKSSLIKAILGLNNYSGSISFDGAALNQATVAKYFGYVPQYITADRDFPITVQELLELECSIAAKTGCANPAHHLGVFAAEHLLHKTLAQLSGGELQKVLVCRALISQPSVLLLDEPSNNLDKASRKILTELLQQLHASGVSIIHITHDHHELLQGSNCTHLQIEDAKLVHCEHD